MYKLNQINCKPTNIWSTFDNLSSSSARRVSVRLHLHSDAVSWPESGAPRRLVSCRIQPQHSRSRQPTFNVWHISSAIIHQFRLSSAYHGLQHSCEEVNTMRLGILMDFGTSAGAADSPLHFSADWKIWKLEDFASQLGQPTSTY